MSSELLDRRWVVYKHTSPSNKVYIGITSKAPNDRWASGFGYEHQIYFFRAIVKYGWINFKHEILFENLTKKEAESKEIELISYYKSSDLHYGYNIDLGGDLHKLSVETRKKLSAIKTGRKWTERQRLASIEYYKKNPGRTIYKYDLKGNLVSTFKGLQAAANDAGISKKVFSTYIYKRKFPTTWNYTYSYGDFNEDYHKVSHQDFNAKSVDMYDLSLNYIRTFKSIAEAQRFLKENGLGNGSKIWGVCNGIGQTAGHYIWRYHDENRDNKIA